MLANYTFKINAITEDTDGNLGSEVVSNQIEISVECDINQITF